MKIRLLSGILLLAAGLCITSCDDEDDYPIATGEIITEVTTGEASVTAISAEVQGTVKELSSFSAASYEVGAYYGTDENPTVNGTKRSGTLNEGGMVTTTLTGLTTGTTYYYATYVTLQGKVTRFGDVKSFVATAAQITSEDATDITAGKATLTGNVTGIEGVAGTETGVQLALTAEGTSTGHTYPLGTVTGLLPGTTYYYRTFLKVGEGRVYGPVKSFTTLAQQMEYVDLGLSVLWAKCNIGADNEEEAGAYFGYGDQTAMQTSTDNANYPATDIAGTPNDILFALSLDGDSPMKSQLPTAEQLEELVNNTTQEATTVNGVSGIRFTAKNGNSIFMPAAGYREGETVIADAKGHYWSGSLNPTNNAYAGTLAFNGGTAMPGNSQLHLGLSVRPIRAYDEVIPEQGRIVFGDLESNGRMRIEIYNEYGSTAANPPIDPTSIKFSKNMVVSFTLSGITDNLKEGAAGSYVAGLEYSDPTWGVGYWSALTNGIYEATVTGDGTYTVWMETSARANGAIVYCVDIAGLWADIADPSKVGVTLNSIKLDADINQVPNHDIVNFNNKDGNGTDGRIEIYNEYSTSGAAAPGCYNSSLAFNGLMLVDFTITGIDGNLATDAAGSYNTELSYADADWNPSYWGGAGYGNATVTGDGTYQVYAYLNGDCEGAVVWTIELYGLWKDLVDASKVQVKINRVITPGKK